MSAFVIGVIAFIVGGFCGAFLMLLGIALVWGGRE